MTSTDYMIKPATVGFTVTHVPTGIMDVFDLRSICERWITRHAEMMAPVEAQEEVCETVHVKVGNGAVIHKAQQGTNPYGVAFLYTHCGAEGRGGHNYIPRVVNAPATCKRCTGA